MFEIVILVAAGAFLGWNLPQPFWAVYAQDWFETKWKALKDIVDKIRLNSET